MDASKLTSSTNEHGREVWWREKGRGKARKRVQVCGSNLRNKPGQRCGREIGLSEINGRCDLHGKNAGAPITTGNYSEKLGPLREAYNLMRAKGGARDLVDAITIIDLRVAELVEGLEQRDSPGFRRQALELARKVEVEMATDYDAGQKALRELLELLSKGVEKDKAWDAVLATLDRRARRAEAMLKLETTQERTLTDKAVLGFLQVVVQIVVQHSPKDVANRVVDEIQKRLERPGGVAGVPGDTAVGRN